MLTGSLLPDKREKGELIMEQKKNYPTFLRTHNAAGMWQNISKAMKGGAEIKWHLPITQAPPPPEVTWFVW